MRLALMTASVVISLMSSPLRNFGVSVGRELGYRDQGSFHLRLSLGASLRFEGLRSFGVYRQHSELSNRIFCKQRPKETGVSTAAASSFKPLKLPRRQQSSTLTSS